MGCHFLFQGPSPPRAQTYVFYTGRRVLYQEPPGFPILKGKRGKCVRLREGEPSIVGHTAGEGQCWVQGLQYVSVRLGAGTAAGMPLPSSGASPAGSALLGCCFLCSCPAAHTLLPGLHAPSFSEQQDKIVHSPERVFFFCYCCCIQAPAELMSFWNVT